MAEAKIQFTPAQAAAIQARGGSLLVSAAAGSQPSALRSQRYTLFATMQREPACFRFFPPAGRPDCGHRETILLLLRTRE